MRAIAIAGTRTEGFTYIAVLAVLMVVAISAQTAVSLTSTDTQREREAELLFRGKAYQDAIRSFYHAANPRRYPRSLEELLEDPRFLHRRHLRRLYADPMGTEWRLIRDRQGGIIGVASGSDSAPFKRADFPPGFEHFEGATRYSDWQFLYSASSEVTNKNYVNKSTNQRGSMPLSYGRDAARTFENE